MAYKEHNSLFMENIFQTFFNDMEIQMTYRGCSPVSYTPYQMVPSPQMGQRSNVTTALLLQV